MVAGFKNHLRCGEMKMCVILLDPNKNNNNQRCLKVILYVIHMSFLCPSKNDAAFKIIIGLVIDQN
jgi:hypothetical protein